MLFSTLSQLAFGDDQAFLMCLTFGPIIIGSWRTLFLFVCCLLCTRNWDTWCKPYSLPRYTWAIN